jgi:hypothetical protein
MPVSVAVMANVPLLILNNNSINSYTIVNYKCTCGHVRT